MLGDKVVFVGAIAVLSYLGWGYRSTKDIDMALASGTPPEYLEERGFRRVKETLYSPGGFKVDVYTKEVNGVPVDELFRESVVVRVGRTEIRVPRLEHLLVTKLTGRHQDVEDLRTLLWKHGASVDWSYLKERYLWAYPELRRIYSAVSGGGSARTRSNF